MFRFMLARHLAARADRMVTQRQAARDAGRFATADVLQAQIISLRMRAERLCR